MNEENNRKILVSFKVSTLLIVAISIIVLGVITNIIINKVQYNFNLEVSSINNVEKSKDIENNIETINTSEENSERLIRAEISSRSSASRVEGSIEQVEETTESVEENIEQEATPELVTTPIEEVAISKDMDLTVRTGLSRDDFITLIAGVEQDTSNFFEENAGLIYDLCEKYQLNEIFFCGLISAESGWNIASNHRNTHNYISLMSNGGLIKYSSVEEGLEKAAQTLHDNYLTPGGRFYYGATLAGMKTKFCPSSSTWVNLVYQRMEQILN